MVDVVRQSCKRMEERNTLRNRLVVWFTAVLTSLSELTFHIIKTIVYAYIYDGVSEKPKGTRNEANFLYYPARQVLRSRFASERQRSTATNAPERQRNR